MTAGGAQGVPLVAVGLADARVGDAANRVRRWSCRGVLFAGDALALAGASGLVLRALDPSAASADLALLAGAAELGLLASAGLYPGNLLLLQERLRRRVLALYGAAALAVVAAALLLHSAGLCAVTLVALVTAFPVQVALRALLIRALHKLGLWATLVNVVGAPSQSAALADALAADWELGLVPVATTQARVAVLADPMPEASVLADLRARYDEVILLADTVSSVGTGLKPSDLSGRFGLCLRAPATNLPGTGLRRLRDLAVAVPALLAVAPILLVAGVLIWRADPGPIFYRQTREGLNGRPIRVWKLRTMYQDSERMLRELLDRDPDARREWEAHFKLREDPRLLPGIGKLLRATSLDELPQLLNIVSGDMTLVGPRPFPVYHLEAVPPAFRNKRATVVPGLTGLWQVSERSEADLARLQQLDEFYIDNRSAWLDAVLILATFRAVIRRTGA